MIATESSSPDPAAVQLKQCRYCGTNIALAAILCPTCKSYQDPWRNRLLFIAGLAGFLTLVASGLTFMAQHGVQAYKSLLWRPGVSVLELEAMTGNSHVVVVSNSGDRPVLLSRVIIYWDRASMTVTLNRIIQANAIEAITGEGVRPTVQLIGNETGIPSPRLAHRSTLPYEPACIVPVFFSHRHRHLLQMSEHYARAPKHKLIIGAAQANLTFFGGPTASELKVDVPVVVTFGLNQAQECKDAERG